MDWGDLGGGLIGQGIASFGSNITDALRQKQALQQMQELGSQIQSGDLLGAAQTAISRGDINTGLKLYQLHRSTADDAGLGEKLSTIMNPGAVPAAPALPAAPIAVPEKRASINPTTFATGLAPQALEASRKTGIDPRIIVAQAAVESGFGQHAPGNNLFGIKSPDGSGNTLATTEMDASGNPYLTKANFMSYASPADSVSGYADFINANPRYAALKASGSLDDQITALGKSGYATDPNYAAKVGFIARGIDPSVFRGTNAAQGIQLAMGRAPDGTAVMPIAAGAPATKPDDEDPPDTSDTSAARPLGPPPTIPDSPAIQALIQRRNALIGLMPQAASSEKYKTMIPAAIHSLEEQISAARTDWREQQKEPLQKAQRAYEAENMLGYKRGSSEWKDYVAYGTRNPDKDPKTFNRKNPDGTETTMMWVNGKAVPVPGGEPPPPDPSIPAGVDPVQYKKSLAMETAKANTKNVQATLDSKKTADKIIPLLDQAIDAYTEISKRGGLGKVNALAPNRFIEGVLGSETENQRQIYERAINNLNATSNIFKGQGAVSDFERKLMSARFPALSDIKGAPGIKFLQDMKKDLENASHDVYGGDPTTFDDGTKIQKIK